MKVPPPRPAFPKTAVSTGSVEIAGRKGEREKEEEEEIWARLEQQEKDEELAEAAGSDIPKSTAIITFKHSEALPCSINTSAPVSDDETIYTLRE